MARASEGGSALKPVTIPIYKPPAPSLPPAVIGGRPVARPVAALPSNPLPALVDTSAADFAREQKAEQAKRDSKTSARLLKQARSLEGQIKAIRFSLSTGQRAALNQRLANITLNESQGITLLKRGYADRTKSLDEAEQSNTKAAAGASQEALLNRNRERAQLLAEAASQGAGESDVLRAQQVSLRSWSANQSEVARGFHDTLNSINASLRDLNVDTRTGFANVVANANGDRDSTWTNFFNQQSEGLIQLGNLYGQRAETLGMANEFVENTKVVGDQDASVKNSDDAFMRAARENAKAYKDPGLPAWITKWEGQSDYKSGMAPRTFAEANPAATRVARPEGASLRKWAR